MELCVGIICGTIPALRPLLVHGNNEIGGIRGQYWKPDPLTLELKKRGLIKSPPLRSAPTIPAAMAQPLFAASSTSEERILEPHNRHGILKTLEIEVKNEGAENSDSREDYNQGWNSV